MRLTYAAAIAALVSIAGGCSLFTSLNGYSKDADDPIDGGGGDAGGDSGGGGDAGSDAAGGPFCSSTVDAALCEDFDDLSDTTFSAWARSTINGGSVAYSDAGRSPPRALESIAAASTGASGFAEAHLERTVNGTKRTRFVYKFLIEKRDDTGPKVPFSQLTMLVGDSRVSVRMQLENGIGRFEGAVYPDATSNPSFPDLTPTFPLKLATWYSVDITCNWDASPARATIDFDGKRVATDAPITGATFGIGKLQVTAGIYYLSAGPEWRVLVDDVALWVE